MKVFIVLLAIVAAAIYFAKSRNSRSDPEVIVTPTYAEVHMTADARGRSFEQVLFAKTVDDADCRKFTADTLQKVSKRWATKPGSAWTIKSSECKAELEPRFARLFDNQPAFVTYVSIARGDRSEREARLIYWGVTVKEGDAVCDGVVQLQNDTKGRVSCIRALPVAF